MRIAFVTDLHVSTSHHWEEGRRVRAWYAAEIDKRAAAGHGPDVIVCGGDVFHAPPTPAELLEAVLFFERLAARAPVVITRGNHDARGILDVLAHLATMHPIHVFTEPGVHRIAGASFAVLPWIDAIGPAPDAVLTRADREAAEQDAVRALLDRLGAALTAGEPGIFAGHVAIRGAVPGAGQPDKAGREVEIAAADLDRVGADVFLLGHVHRGQDVALPSGRPALYGGSPHRTAFGELEEKCVLFVEIGGGDVSVESVPTPAAPMLLAQASWRDGAWLEDPAEVIAAVEAARADAAPGAVPLVRLGFSVSADQRDAAALAAAALRAKLEALGAHVVLDPKVLAPIAVRCPEIASASAMAEKLQLFLRTDGKRDDDPVVARAFGALADVEKKLGLRRGGVPTGGARVRRLRFRGFGIYREETVLDLDAIPGDVVAIVGDNGHGKSTALAAIQMALYRRVQKAYGAKPLSRFVSHPDGFLEATVDVNGAPHRIFHRFATDKSYVYRHGEDEPIEKRGTGFSKWAAENVLPFDVHSVSLFGPQMAEGLIGYKPARRREVLLSALGLDALKRIAKAAGDRANEIEKALARVAAQAEQKERDLCALHAVSETTVVAARGDVAAAERALADARAGETAFQAAEQRRQAREAAVSRHRAAVDALGALETQRAELERALADAGAIRAAVAELARIDAETSSGAAELTRLTEAARAAGTRRQEASTRGEEARQRAQAARQRAQRARAVLVDREAVQAAVEALPGREAEHEAAAAALLAAEAKRDALRAEAVERGQRRAERLRGRHGDVLATRALPDAHAIARSALEDDDPMARADAAGGDLATAIAAEVAAVAQQAVLHAQAAERRAAAERLAARAPALAQAAEDLAAAEKEAETEDAAARRADDQAATARGEEQAARGAHAAKSAQQGVLHARRTDVAALAGRAALLDRAEGSLAALQAPVAAAGEAERVALGAVPPAETMPVRPDVVAAERRLRAAERELATLEEQGRAAATAREQLAVLEAERARTEADLETWRLLARAFGPTGIQTLEIDAARPALSALATDALHNHFGTRWTIRVDSILAADDGEDKPGLQITVLDAEDGREEDALEYSEGQRAFLGCAVSCAVAEYVCSRTGTTAPTLIRDETGCPVSVENRERYMRMLRASAASIGASKVLLVSHDPALASMADAVIEVRKGTLRVTGRRG